MVDHRLIGYQKTGVTDLPTQGIPALLSMNHFSSLLILVCLLSFSSAQSVRAVVPGTPDTLVGDMIFHPVTGAELMVIALGVGADGNVDYLLTETGELILTKTSVGDTIQAMGESDVYEVVSIGINGDTGLVDTVGLRLSSDPPDTDPILHNVAASLSGELANTARDVSAPSSWTVSGSAQYRVIKKGDDGDDGADGYEYEFCIPTTSTCWTVGVDAEDGENGDTGPEVVRTVIESRGSIETTTDNSPAIVIASIGGDGGDGGDEFSNTEAGAGGVGGKGGTVDLTNYAELKTDGVGSPGIKAMSKSGEGGDGGEGYIWAEGGAGGQSSDGGNVTVDNSGNILTLGRDSSGIHAVSFGGYAGDGGGSWGIVGEGGSGGDSGDGANVTVTNNGTIVTWLQGPYDEEVVTQPGGLLSPPFIEIITRNRVGSHGIFAQSIGGSGGSGGDAGGVAAFGGDAATGGKGGDVEITTGEHSHIYTRGWNSIGVFAQSIGGGGGDSGASGGVVALGGSGGSGNHAGEVTITNNAGSVIITEGHDSHGVFAQSVGGGGGNSSPEGGVVAIGGSSSTGGNGDTVIVDSSALIRTAGINAHGIFAQSVGGGGGSAGTGGGVVAIGGSGSAGGDGKTVTVINREGGDIATSGSGSHAIFAQSVGGGGGAGGGTDGVVSIGGRGDDGGDGGRVSVTNAAALDTAGDDAKGVLAQSIGGGGGASGGSAGLVALGGEGDAAGDGGEVILTNEDTGTIYTSGDGADALFAQSVGGGGGAGGGSKGLVALGGSGDGGGDGGNVTVSNDGILVTEGKKSRGIFAQSVGGGGGAGGDAGALVAIGGSGYNSSHAGDVTVTNTGVILTDGKKSTGIYAQSIGGGGGDGGGSAGGVLTIGGTGDSGGYAGKVTVVNEGQVITQGHQAMGIFAQSVGGGGGAGGSSYSGFPFASVSLGGNGSEGGDGGEVEIVLGNGDSDNALFPSVISTSGQGAEGILAQSVGGGGGRGGNAITGTIGVGVSVSVGAGGDGGGGGDGGKVSLSGEGNIFTAGDNAEGALLQSIGGGGGAGGTTVTGSLAVGIGAGVSVSVGGDGGDGGDGGEVSAVLDTIIRTGGDNATGLLAQSVGGGGGRGANTIAAAGAGGLIATAGVSVGVGGKSGDGGDGGLVDVTIGSLVSGDEDTPLPDVEVKKSSVITTGELSDAIVIQSVGGGGGNGGITVSSAAAISSQGSGDITVGIGSSGGEGGDGGEVNARVYADVETTERGSDGVIFQSVGGGGGNSGLTVSAGASGALVGAVGINVGIGGSSEGGGNGDIVDATYYGHLVTEGSGATGVLAQSVGGGGGNSSGTISASLNGAGTGAGSIAVGIGGSGGSGGDGGREDTDLAVSLDTYGSVMTYGNKSAGIIAQSVGGGGGVGGYSISGSLAIGVTGSGSISANLGGSGSDGGNGKNVLTTLYSNLFTAGKESVGALVQSVGGGGGAGNFSISVAAAGAGTNSGAGSFGLGGSGGGGGDGGDVDSTMAGIIYTLGAYSDALVVQSVGGGGGNGSFNISSSVGGSGAGSFYGAAGIGGSGGDGGDGGYVESSYTGNVYTSGYASDGIVAQSVGGGGGNGGLNITGSIGVATQTSVAVAFGLGGSGGGGGDAVSFKDEDGEYNVSSSVTGHVKTEGKYATGVLAQSVGGGGGNGALNVAGAISGSTTGSGGAISVGIGGFGGDGGDAGNVLNTFTGSSFTTGDSSPGVAAQSIAGGGGNGALNVTGAVNLSLQSGGSLGVGVGGFGGGGGNAGDVTSVLETDSVETTGDDSPAVLAQSVGGGGGTGGINVSGAINFTKSHGAAAGLGLGGFGGDGGNGGNVDLEVDGLVFTDGEGAHGLFAQSVGGGGGLGSLNVSGAVTATNSFIFLTKTVAFSLGVGGFGGDGGDGGEVDVDFDGSVSAWNYFPEENFTGDNGDPLDYLPVRNGDAAHGIFAQSLGGGGGQGSINISSGFSFATGNNDGYGAVIGVGGFGGAGGNASIVDVTAEGSGGIFGSGAGGSAIYAQSVGGGGGDGGINISGGIVSDSPLIFGVGGFGDNGGSGGDVTVTATTDTYAVALNDEKEMTGAGIVAQSIGGGGGNGGLNVSGGISIFKESKVPSLTFGIGGYGGPGAVSGTVDVVHDGNALTSGNWVHGILAQSIAGGGGNGGWNVSGEINGAEKWSSGGKKDLSIVVGIGGKGAEGADSGNVDIDSTGDIATQGNYSRGIFAQSVGGGGGTGGWNWTLNASKNSSPITIGVGGSGSGGGDAGTVDVFRGVDREAHEEAVANEENYSSDPEVQYSGVVSTDGRGAVGIEASSIGGGGGDAGGNINLSGTLAGGDSWNGIGSPVSVNVAIGGSGGEAADGGDVTVDNYGDVFTDGKNSHGIMGQSIGGGGGNASLNMAFSYTKSNSELGETSKSLGLNFGLGGETGNGGTGGNVDVSHFGEIETKGENSYGVLAQSIGGGGGNAGFDLLFSKTTNIMGVTIGRRGGTGGDGGDVFLSSRGSVTTRGNNSYGLLAQSIGNGGGNSAMTTVGATAGDTEANGDDHTFNVSVGLEGGEGGTGCNVTIQEVEGVVETHGFNAHAIFAQSVGGGGGNGGGATGLAFLDATSALSIGGTGGSGGVSGTVDVTSGAYARTYGNNSVGILAQSIGGGGGNAGWVKSGGFQKESGHTQLFNVGGDGGSGMKSGEVTVTNSGTIITGTATGEQIDDDAGVGINAHGILAQSLGGGGGNGSMMTTTFVSNTTYPAESTQMAISVGGKGGTGGSSDQVTVTNTGGIGTYRGRSVGIFAQSIGGGGGNASSVYTGLAGSNSNMAVSVGGSGGSGGTAGNVEVHNNTTESVNSGEIITLGNESHGILAMSVGGGGGNGSDVHSLTFAGKSAKNPSIAVGVGGWGGTGGEGGTVDVYNSGVITTYGDKAHGIVAQSVGGGGGNGGTSVAGNIAAGGSYEKVNLSGSLGGFGGEGHLSGDVTVTNSGDIVVRGGRSYGIYAQSVGGGGGDGGFAVALSSNMATAPKSPVPWLTNLAAGGNGGIGAGSGNVTVNHTGSIESFGDNSYGIFAQSVGGGGGNAGYSISTPLLTAADAIINSTMGLRDGYGGTAGTVTVLVDGTQVGNDDSPNTIIMHGDNSKAVFKQSVNGGGGNVYTFSDFSGRAIDLGSGGYVLPDNGDWTTLVYQDLKLGAVSSELLEGADVWEKSGYDGGVIREGRQVITFGDRSIALFTQSIGGGGGSATNEIVTGNDAEVNLEMELGAEEVDKSPGGYISEERDDLTYTEGDGSSAVVVQSVGGGGGSLTIDVERVSYPYAPSTEETEPAILAVMQAASMTDGVTQTPEGSSITLGARSGTENDGGDIELDYSGDIRTAGDYAHGLIVQSIGAGGGNAMLFGLDSLDVSLGGINGAQGDGGTIRLTNSGTIRTGGYRSPGVLLQSIGGGGGLVVTDLPENLLSISTSEESSGDGGDIRFEQNGDIITTGEESAGVFLQSLGGGGGIVDSLFAGSAGGEGDSGAISFSGNGNVATLGADSPAVFVQSESVQGNSGPIDLSVNGSVATAGDGSHGVDARSGSLLGDSGEISIVIDGSVTTEGKSAPGISAQSRSVEQNSGRVSVDVSGNVVTTGDYSDGVVARSTTDNGSSGSVDVQVSGGVYTSGLDSDGLFARSITESGTSGSVNVNVNGGVYTAGRDSTGVLARSRSTGGDSGEVSAWIGGSVVTTGDNSAGVDLRSKGGHNSGVVSADVLGNIATTGANAPGVRATSSAFSGNAGDVNVAVDGLIETAGDGSAGILATSESRQVNSGKVRISVNNSIVTSGNESSAIEAHSSAPAGKASLVSVMTGGDTATYGNSSHGISASSIGNTGSVKIVTAGRINTSGDFSDGIHAVATGGSIDRPSVDIVTGNSIVASGVGSDGVYAEVNGRDAGSNISVVLNGGLVQGGLGGAAVHVVGGNDNRVVNRGTLATLDGLNGMTVLATTGNEQVENYGTMIGNVDLGTGRNHLYNHAGAHFISGSNVSLGSSGMLTNAGQVSPGGSGRLQTTQIQGNFVQTGSGIYNVDLDFANNRSDRIGVSGSADISGQVRLNTMNPAALRPGHYDAIIVTGGAGVVARSVSLSVLPSAVVDYYLAQTGSGRFAASYDIDFSPAGLESENLFAIGDFFNAMQLAGGSPEMSAYIVDFFRHTDAAELSRTYEYLNPVFYDHFTRTSIDVTRQYGQIFFDHLRGRRQQVQPGGMLGNQDIYFHDNILLAGNEANGQDVAPVGPSVQHSKYNVWMNLLGQRGEVDSVDDMDGYEFDTFGLALGLDYLVRNRLLIGASFGLSGTDLSVDDTAGEGSFDSHYVSLYGSYFSDLFYLDGQLSFGLQDYETTRFTRVLGEDRLAVDEYDGNVWSTRGEIGKGISYDEWLIQPFFGLGFIDLEEESHAETGADGLSLVIDDQSTQYLGSDLGLRFSRIFPMVHDRRLALDLSAAWNHDFGIDDATVVAGFAGYPGGTFAVEGRSPEPNGIALKGGVKLFGSAGLSATLQCQGEWRDDQVISRVAGFLNYKF